jgi:hypothetical protein
MKSIKQELAEGMWHLAVVGLASKRAADLHARSRKARLFSLAVLGIGAVYHIAGTLRENRQRIVYAKREEKE